MVTLQNVSFEFAGRWLYRNANWQIKPGEKIGLIGKNGTGKSTLLRLIVKEYSTTEGEISRQSDLNIGFLNQDLLSFSSTDSIFNVAMGAFAPLLAVEAEIESLLHKMETEVTDEAIHRLSELQHAFETRGGYEMEARVHEVLDGLGFSLEDRNRPYAEFSGGWRMRVMLAKILLTDPDLLLLDEPTNHLDLPSILWLESYLQKFRGTYIIVSHDRYFLDRMVDKIVEVAHQRLNFYTGNYTSYITQKAERSAIHANSYENQQRQIAEAERFIERFRAKASKASQAQSRIKMLEKMDRIDAPDTDEPTVSFRFRKTERCGNEVLALKNATKRFDAKVILKGTNATITRGDKIGLIGANGTGKSTVLRMIAGTEPFEGERIVGHKVVPAFFAQHQLEALHLNFTILEEFHEEILEYTETYVRGVLGGFLFTGDDVKKRISVLSGGEKSRVALAKTLLSHANFLLLDEPTNHLDMQSIQIMTEALREYDGTYIIVSHDRYFLEQITNKIWYIEDQEVKEYPGSYTEYAWWREKQAQDAANTKAPKVEKKEEPATKTQSKKTNQAPQATKVADPKARKQLENKIKNIESSIEKLENQKQNLEAQMAEAATDFNKLADIQRKHAETDRELQTVLENWEALCYELEQI